MLGLLSRATANLKNTASPSGWSPADDVPSGFSSHRSTLAVPLSSLGTFAFRSVGHYAQGTVVFARAEVQAGTEPPSYGEAVQEKPRVEGTVNVEVEVRTNSDGLYGECRLEVVEAHERGGLSLTTPASASVSRLGASLSYHITVTFPSSFTALDTLFVETTGFRLVLAPSVSALTIGTLSLRTTDAPIVLSSTQCGSAQLSNQNQLDPNRHALKNFDDLLSGSLVATGRIDLACENGPIAGSYTAGGPLVARTSNFPLRGEFRGSSVRITNANAEISGTFAASGPRGDVVVQNVHGKVEGTFVAPGGCEVKGLYVGVKGDFEVGGHLRLLTTVFRIDATIRLLAPSAASVPGGSSSRAPVTRVASTTSDLPTYGEQQTTLLLSSSSAGAGGVIAVSAETTDAGVELLFPAPVPPQCALRTTARSTGGSRVGVTHASGWEGRFAASTSLTHTASLRLPPSAASSSAAPVHFDVQKRSEVRGWVGSGAGAGAGDGRNSTTVEAEGEAEVVLLSLGRRRGRARDRRGRV
ncbi:hypothetical protein JCM10450v2_008193 [Rhodotorula kratochvilovae]